MLISISLLLFLISLFALPAAADRGMISMEAKVDSSVYEPSQTAIIAWNGVEEILILTTTASTPEGGRLLEFMPLPSKPTSIEPAPLKTFERAVSLVKKKAPRFKMSGTRNGVRDTNGATPGIEVVMKTTVGPHNITVVRVEDADRFYDWINDFFVKEGVPEKAKNALGFKRIVASYVQREIKYFVFDVVDTGKGPVGGIEPNESNGISPLLYRFKTDRLYYPLNISSRLSGNTKITLFLITPGMPKADSLKYGFSFENYILPVTSGDDSKKTVAKKIPISFPVDLVERVFLSPVVARLISGFSTRAYFSLISYSGSPKYLRYDFELSRDDFEPADFECVERALVERERFRGGTPEGYRNIVLSKKGNSFKTGGSDDHTSAAAVDGDPQTPYTLPVGGSWRIDLGAETEVESVDILAAVKEPDIDPSKNSLYLFRSDTGEFTGEEKRIDTTYLESVTTNLFSDNPYHNAKRVRLTERSFRARYIEIRYPYSESTSPIYLFEVMILVKDGEK